MSLRRVVFWTHLLVGAGAGLVIAMMAVTGVILTYEAQLNRWAIRDYRSSPEQEDAVPLRLDELVEQVGGAQGAARVASVALRRDPLDPALVRFDDRSSGYFDRFNGEFRGDGNTRMRGFLRTVMYWHRWFALDGEFRIVGRTVTAASNLGFLFLLVSGIYIWWPSARSWPAWRQVLWFRRGLRGRARNFNWHSVIGFWAAVPLAVIVGSGATISYRWAGDLVYRIVGEDPPIQSSRQAPQGEDGEPEVPPAPVTHRAGLQVLMEKAVAGIPDWRTVTVAVPDSLGEPASIAVDRGTGRQPSKSERLLFDQHTGDFVGRAGYPTESRGLKVRRWLRFAHTGEIYGVVGQTVAGVVSLGVTVMVWTGLAMSWRRFFASAGRS